MSSQANRRRGVLTISARMIAVGLIFGPLLFISFVPLIPGLAVAVVSSSLAAVVYRTEPLSRAYWFWLGAVMAGFYVAALMISMFD